MEQTTKPANLGKRYFAFFFDRILLFTFLPFIGFAVRRMIPYPANVASVIEPLFIVSLILVWFLYYPISWWRFGQTLGNWVLDIRIVNLNLDPISFGQAIVRFVSCLALSSFLGLGFLWALIDGKSQTWHDKLAKTLVVDVAPEVENTAVIGSTEQAG